jgi:hypothetical protein
MADIATLGIAIDAGQVVKATRDLDGLTAAAKRSTEAATGVTQGFKKVESATAAASQRATVLARESGRNQAIALAQGLEQQFKADIARIKEGQARGFLSEAEAREEGRQAALAYNQGIVGVLDQASKTKSLSGKAGQDAFVQIAGSIKNVGVEARKAGIGINSLRAPLATFASQTVGANPAISQLASIIGSMALGTGLMTGVLLGLAAMAKGWELITRRSREAKAALTETRDRIMEVARIRALGPDGQMGADASAARDKVNSLQAQLDAGGLTPIGREQIQKQLDEWELLAAAAEVEVLRNRQEREQDAARERLAILEREQAEKEALRQREEALLAAHVDRMLEQQARLVRLGGAPGSEAMARDNLRRFRNNLAGPSLDPVTAIGSSVAGTTPLPEATARSGIAGFAGDFMSGLKSGVMGLAASFGPLAVAAAALKPVFEGMMEVLGPAIKTITEPLAALGRIIGTVLAPQFEILGKIVGFGVKVISYLYEAIGNVIKAIGWLIDKLNIFGGDGGIGKFGQDIIDASKAARKNTEAVNEMTAAIQKASANIPDMAPIELWRYRVGMGQGGGFNPAGGGTGLPRRDPYMPAPTDGGRTRPEYTTIIIEGDFVSTATNGEAVYQEVKRRGERDIRNGGIGLSRAVA